MKTAGRKSARRFFAYKIFSEIKIIIDNLFAK